MINAKKKTALAIKGISNRRVYYNLPKEHIICDVPYYSQWESPNLAEGIINGTLQANDDPKWAKSGAKNIQQYADWSWNGCGIACLRMILQHHFKHSPGLVPLGLKSLEYGVYTIPLNESHGLLYKPFKTFLENEYDLKVKIKKALTIIEIQRAVSKNRFVIASVSPKIRNPKDHPVHKGGHLVLVVGYDLDNRVFYINNPSGFTTKSQSYAKIGFKDFKKFFSNQGLEIYR